MNSNSLKRCMKPNSILSLLPDFPIFDWEADCFLDTPRATCSSGMSSKPLSSIVSCCDVGPPGNSQTGISQFEPEISYDKVNKYELLPSKIQLQPVND